MIDKFIEFENKYELFNLKIDDFDVWPYIRFEMYFAIGEFFDITNGVGSTPKMKFTDITSMIWNSFISNPIYTVKKHDIMFIPHQRRIFEDGKYRCIYTDSLSKRIQYSKVSAEFLFGKMHYKPAMTKNLIYLDYVDVWPAIQYKFSHRKKMDILNAANILRSNIQAYFGIGMDENYIEGLICKRYYWHKYKKPIIKKFLKKISPKIIIEVVSYETNKMIINEVAYEMGIPCIELQHGVIGKGHIAYNYRLKSELKQLPTYLFVYSKYWKDTCSFPIGKERIIATGFPYMEEQMLRYPKRNFEGKHRIIIYSSTDNTGNIKDFAEKIIRIMDERGIDYEVIYKLHPLEYSYDSDIWKSIKKCPNVSFIDAPNKSLYELCSNADIQVGVKTTAIFEGLSYGLRTFILHTGAPDIDFYMGDLVRQGYAVYGKTATDFVDFLLNNSHKIESDGVLDNAFFTKSALSKIEQEIERIIQLE